MVDLNHTENHILLPSRKQISNTYVIPKLLQKIYLKYLIIKILLNIFIIIDRKEQLFAKNKYTQKDMK